jgi:hypothetical protein
VRVPTLLPLCALLLGCAGFRGGWQSVAYVGDTPPAAGTEARSPSELADLSVLELPGARLQVSIDNQLRTRDTQIYLGVPLSVNPRRTYPQNHVPGKTRVFVSVTPAAPGFVFRPASAVLEAGGTRITATRGFEFGMWDAAGNRVETGGRWDHRDIGSELVLGDANRRYLLSLEFDLAVPSPESRDIRLDLSAALRDPARAPLPVIRFAPMRWSEGYS